MMNSTEIKTSKDMRKNLPYFSSYNISHLIISMRCFLLTFFLLSTSPALAKHGVVLFNENGKIISINQEALRYRNKDWDKIEGSEKGCQAPFAFVSSSSDLEWFKGRPILDIFNWPEVKDLIRDALRYREGNDIRLIINKKDILDIEVEFKIYSYSSYNLSKTHHLVGSLTFRYLEDIFQKLDKPKKASLKNAKKYIMLTEETEDSLKYNLINLYLNRNLLFLNDQKIDLTPEEFTIIQKLIESPNEFHSISDILQDIPNAHPENSDALLNSLTNKLANAGKHIQRISDEKIRLQSKIIKGQYKGQYNGDIIIFNDLVIDPNSTPGKIFVEGQETLPNRKQFYVIYFLARRSNIPFTKNEIIQRINQEHGTKYKSITGSVLTISSSKLGKYSYMIKYDRNINKWMFSFER